MSSTTRSKKTRQPLRRGQRAKFPKQLYDLLNNEKLKEHIYWAEDGKGFWFNRAQVGNFKFGNTAGGKTEANFGRQLSNYRFARFESRHTKPRIGDPGESWSYCEHSKVNRESSEEAFLALNSTARSRTARGNPASEGYESEDSHSEHSIAVQSPTPAPTASASPSPAPSTSVAARRGVRNSLQIIVPSPERLPSPVLSGLGTPFRSPNPISISNLVSPVVQSADISPSTPTSSHLVSSPTTLDEIFRDINSIKNSLSQIKDHNRQLALKFGENQQRLCHRLDSITRYLVFQARSPSQASYLNLPPINSARTSPSTSPSAPRTPAEPRLVLPPSPSSSRMNKRPVDLDPYSSGSEQGDPRKRMKHQYQQYQASGSSPRYLNPSPYNTPNTGPSRSPTFHPNSRFPSQEA